MLELLEKVHEGDGTGILMSLLDYFTFWLIYEYFENSFGNNCLATITEGNYTRSKQTIGSYHASELCK